MVEIAMAVWAVADSIVSPLGKTTEENYTNVKAGRSGVAIINVPGTSRPVTASGMSSIDHPATTSRFESLCIQAIENLSFIDQLERETTLFILSTTKGNIDFLERSHSNNGSIHLHSSAAFIATHFGFQHHVVISNACISGVLALITGKRYIESGKYRNVVVAGADVLSDFVVSGFESLQALSNEPCRPFDKDRKGINLGEGAGAVLLTATPKQFNSAIPIRVVGAGVSNDANHISGPSRTGEELAFAIGAALRKDGLTAADIDFVSSHGTATLYNDEMEAKAFSHAGMSNVPLNSLKGYFGHTLGAAGVIESIISMRAMSDDTAIASKGFDHHGVSRPLNVCRRTEKLTIKRLLKTASGFGGCNAALVLAKE
jgi:3-oxoacyl-[acyl-carrier-protein] synthase I